MSAAPSTVWSFLSLQSQRANLELWYPSLRPLQHSFIWKFRAPQTCCHGAPGSDPGSESVNPPGSLIFPVNSDAESVWRTKTPVSWGRATLAASNVAAACSWESPVPAQVCGSTSTHGGCCKMFWIVLDDLKQEDFNRLSLSTLERLKRGRIAWLCVSFFIWSLWQNCSHHSVHIVYIFTCNQAYRLSATWWGKWDVWMLE